MVRLDPVGEGGFGVSHEGCPSRHERVLTKPYATWLGFVNSCVMGGDVAHRLAPLRDAVSAGSQLFRYRIRPNSRNAEIGAEFGV